MATRRQVLGYGAAMAAVTAPTAEALAQAVAATGQVTQSGLVGKLEGATQSSAIPTSFKEAPQLAELVKQGKLPPVEQRVPAEPMVIKPLDGIGKYGGTWRRAFIGPSDGENGNRMHGVRQAAVLGLHRQQDRALRGEAYDLSKDGKTTTLVLRKGMKWGDGSPFTADDFVFWYEDMYSNKDIVPAPIAEMSAGGGKQGTRLVKIDETTVQFQFDNPYFLFPDMLAGDTLIGGGQAVRQSAGNSYAAYAPAKYPEAVPAQIFVGGRGHPPRQGSRLRHLGADAAREEGLGTEPRVADAGAMAHHPPDQHADLGDGAQSLAITPSTPTATRCRISTAWS